MYQSSGLHFISPEKSISRLHLTYGMKVADFGAGSGAYTFAVARAIGPSGRVYAIDIQKDLLEKIKTEAREQHLSNIEVLWGDLEQVGGTKLGDEVVQVVVISNVLFQTKGAYQVALEAKRVLKVGGRVLLIDWEGSFGGIGPKTDDVLTKDEVVAIFEQAGFESTENFLAGPHHYGIIFNKK